jgi:hypothetical protein
MLGIVFLYICRVLPTLTDTTGKYIGGIVVGGGVGGADMMPPYTAVVPLRMMPRLDKVPSIEDGPTISSTSPALKVTPLEDIEPTPLVLTFIVATVVPFCFTVAENGAVGLVPQAAVLGKKLNKKRTALSSFKYKNT